MERSERRKYSRYAKRIIVRINNRPGMMLDLSSQGMKISTSMVPVSRNVRISFMADDNSFNLDGYIIWINRRFSIQNLKEIGIMLQNSPQTYQEFVKGVLAVPGADPFH